MKLSTPSRMILALIDGIASLRRTALRELRCYRREFSFTRTKRHWATRYLRGYMTSKASLTTHHELLAEAFGKLVRTLTIKPRFNGLGVAA